MKNFYLKLLFLVPFAVYMTACDKDSSAPSDTPEPENKIVDLSAQEMANCYIVQAPGVYKFKADNQFNLGPDLPVPPEIHPVSASLIWQTVPGSIDSVELVSEEGETPYVIFEVSESKGNALISVIDDEGNIEWSWHIWMPVEKISSVHTATGYEVMNMNLGALNNVPGDADSYGMLYQWGRKDPLPASATLTGTVETLGTPLFDIDNNPVEITYSSWGSANENTIEHSIKHPTECMSNYAQYSKSRDWLRSDCSDDSLWGNPLGDARDSETNQYINKGRKTCYDPSPAGWRVPPADVFRNVTSSGGYAWTFDDFYIKDINGDGIKDSKDYQYGWHFLINGDSAMYFPAASRYDGSYAMLMGSMSGLWGNYWSNSPYSTIPGGAFCSLAFQVQSQSGQEMITVSPSGGGSRADAYSVRCIREY